MIRQIRQLVVFALLAGAAGAQVATERLYVRYISGIEGQAGVETQALLGTYVDSVRISGDTLFVVRQNADNNEATAILPPEVVNVTGMGPPQASASTIDQVFVDAEIPRLWFTRKETVGATLAAGTFADYTDASGDYRGARPRTNRPSSPSVGDYYYDTTNHHWYVWETTRIFTTEWHQRTAQLAIGDNTVDWLGDAANAAEALTRIADHSDARRYIFYNVSSGTVQELANNTYVAPTDAVDVYSYVTLPGATGSGTGLTAGDVEDFAEVASPSATIPRNRLRADAVDSTKIENASISHSDIRADVRLPSAVGAPDGRVAKVSGDAWIIGTDNQRHENRILPDPSTGITGQVAKINADGDGWVVGNDLVGATGSGITAAQYAGLTEDFAEVDSADANIPATRLTPASIDSTYVADGGIIGDDLKDDAVPADKIADDAIERRHLQSGIIIAQHIAANQITHAHLQNNIVEESELAPDAVGNDEIQNNAVTGNKIQSNSIDSTDVINGGIAGADIAAQVRLPDAAGGTAGQVAVINTGTDGWVLADQTGGGGTGEVSRAELADSTSALRDDYDDSFNSVGFSNASRNLTFSRVGGGTAQANLTYFNAYHGVVTVDRTQSFSPGDGITWQAVTYYYASNVSDDVTLSDIPADSRFVNISGGGSSFDAATYAAKTEDFAEVDSTNATIPTARIADDAITAAKIADDAVGTDQIINSSIASIDILNGAVEEFDLADNAVITSKIADNAVTGSKIAAGARLPDASSGTAGQVAKVNAAGDGWELAADVGDPGAVGNEIATRVEDFAEVDSTTARMPLNRRYETLANLFEVGNAESTYPNQYTIELNPTGGRQDAVGDMYLFQYDPGSDITVTSDEVMVSINGGTARNIRLRSDTGAGRNITNADLRRFGIYMIYRANNFWWIIAQAQPDWFIGTDELRDNAVTGAKTAQVNRLPDASSGTAGQVAVVNPGTDGWVLADQTGGSGGGLTAAAIEDFAEVDSTTATIPTGRIANQAVELGKLASNVQNRLVPSPATTNIGSVPILGAGSWGAGRINSFHHSTTQATQEGDTLVFELQPSTFGSFGYGTTISFQTPDDITAAADGAFVNPDAAGADTLFMPGDPPTKFDLDELDDQTVYIAQFLGQASWVLVAGGGIGGGGGGGLTSAQVEDFAQVGVTGTIPTARIADNAVTASKLSDLTERRLPPDPQGEGNGELVAVFDDGYVTVPLGIDVHAPNSRASQSGNQLVFSTLPAVTSTTLSFGTTVIFEAPSSITPTTGARLTISNMLPRRLLMGGNPPTEFDLDELQPLGMYIAVYDGNDYVLLDGQGPTAGGGLALADYAAKTEDFAEVDSTSATIPTARIADDAITNEKIADNTIVAGNIASNAVQTAEINQRAVTGAKIADDAVIGRTIADDAVTSAHIDDATIATIDLADDAVTTGKIDDDAVTQAKVADNAVGNAQMADNAIGADEIIQAIRLPTPTSGSAGQVAKVNTAEDGWILAVDAGAGTGLVDSELAAKVEDFAEVDSTTATIPNARLGDDIITTRTINDRAVTEAHIASNSISNRTLQNDAVHSADILDGSIQGIDINAGVRIADASGATDGRATIVSSNSWTLSTGIPQQANSTLRADNHLRIWLTDGDSIVIDLSSLATGGGGSSTTHTRYALTTTGNTQPTAAEFQAGATSQSNTITVPATATNHYLWFADIFDDLTDIREQGSAFNSRTSFTTTPPALDIGGTTHYVYGSLLEIFPTTEAVVWVLNR